MVNVPGFPTIVGYLGVGTHNPYTKKSIRMPTLYSGAKTAKGITRWAMRKMASFVTVVKNDKGLEAFQEDASKAKTKTVVLFSAKNKVAPLLKSLSTDFHRRLSFAAVHGTANETAKMVAAAGVTEFPALLVFEGEATTAFEGDFKDKAAIAAFLEGHARDAAALAAEDAAKRSGVKPTAELTPENFEKTVLGSEEAWVVAYTADGKAVADSLTGWDEMHGQLHDQGLLRSGRVNCKGHTDAESGFCKDVLHKRGKKGLPALVVYPAHKVSDAKDAIFMGGLDVDDAAEKAGDSIKSTLMPLPLGMDPQILDKFMAQGVQQKKVALILFTKKDGPPAGLRSISAEFSGLANVAFVSSPPQATLDRFQIKKLPQMVLMAPGAEEKDPAGGEEKKMNFQIVMYQESTHGKMNFNNIAGFLHSVGLRKENMKGGSGANKAESASLEKREIGPIQQLTAKNFEALCGSKRLCVVGVFDGAGESPRWNWPDSLAEELLTLESIRGEANAAYRFMWLDGVCNAGAAAALGVENGMPSLVVYSPKKKVSAPLVGSFNNKTVAKFLKGVLSGRTRTSPVRGAVTFIDQDCGEFHEAQAAAMEPEAPQEEADDMMAEILAEEAREKEELKATLKAEKKARKEAEKAEKAAKVKAEEDEKEAVKAKARKKRRKKKKAKKKKAAAAKKKKAAKKD